MSRILLAVAVLALPAAMPADEQRDWLIIGQWDPRAPDLISRDLVPPPLDLATTQVAPGQWLSLPRVPQPIPQAELDQASPGAGPGATICLEGAGDGMPLLSPHLACPGLD